MFIKFKLETSNNSALLKVFDKFINNGEKMPRKVFRAVKVK